MGDDRRYTQLAVAALLATAALGAGCGRIGYDDLLRDGGVPSDLGSDAADSPNDAALGPDAGRCPGPTADAVCERLRAVPDSPVIDGVVECGLALVPLVPRAWTSTGPIPSGHGAELAITWHADGVYFFVHVVSPTVRPPGATDDSYCGDGVEVYLDGDGLFAASPDYDRPGTRQFIIPAPAGASSTRASAYDNTGATADWAVGRAIAVRTADGYVVEAFVRREDVLLPPASFSAGNDVGIDVSVNVAAPADAAGTCGRRLGQYFLSATNRSEPPAGRCDGLPFCDVSAFCTPQLMPAGG